MTNAIAVRAVANTYGGFFAEIKKVHRATWERVRVNGEEQVYDTADQAEVAAWRALHAHLCSDIVGEGERVSARSAAEALFIRGRKVEVERR